MNQYAKEEWKKIPEQERIAEWNKVHDYFVNERAKCKDFLHQNITLFDHCNNNQKIINYKGETEFVNYDGEYGYGLMCKHCGKLMIMKDGNNKTLGRLVRFMLNHLEKIHTIKMESYSTSLNMYSVVQLEGMKNVMIMRDGIE